MNTSLLSGAVLFALVTTVALMARRGWDVTPRLGALSGGFVAGALTVPTLLIAYFGSSGALADMRYCILTHNYVPGLGNWQVHPRLPLLMPPGLLLIVWPAQKLV